LLKQQAGGSGSDFKSSDENLMFRQAGELLGGIFDQQGNLQNLDPENRSKVQAITTRAAELFQSGETQTRSQAVTEAARQLGISVQNLGGGGSKDRNQLLEMYGTQ
jgi:hypothetical protein